MKSSAAILFLLIIFLFVFKLNVQATTISGYVFIDKNNNGRYDALEPGVPQVGVSNQLQVVATNTQGQYKLETEGYGLIVVSVPNGFSCSTFWQRISSTSETAQVNFALTPSPAVNSFTFVHASDTHVSEQSLDRMKKFKSAVDQVKPDFTIVTGDLVKDALRVSEAEASSYYELYKREIAGFTKPVWNVPGNHETFGIERHLSLVDKKNPLYGRKMYRHYLGPDYYSFNYGGVHFMALNVIDFDDLWYYGHVDSVQMQWIKQDLALVPATTPVVTFHHMAMFSPGLSLDPFEEYGPGRSLELEKGKPYYRHVVSNAMDIMTILKDYNYVLSLAGHFHQRQISRFEVKGKQTRYEQASSVIAPYTRGPYQVPSGITVYTVKNGIIDEGRFIDLDQ